VPFGVLMTMYLVTVVSVHSVYVLNLLQLFLITNLNLTEWKIAHVYMHEIIIFMLRKLLLKKGAIFMN